MNRRNSNPSAREEEVGRPIGGDNISRYKKAMERARSLPTFVVIEPVAQTPAVKSERPAIVDEVVSQANDITDRAADRRAEDEQTLNDILIQQDQNRPR